MTLANSITSSVSQIFHPLVAAVAWLLAKIYEFIPNYAIAIAILTVIVMALLTPLTIKSTKSMIAMQRIQPELRRLQQKYKGPEYRQELNEEMMRLYREEGVNPAMGCIVGMLQAPFLFILYTVIRGLSNTVMVAGHLVSEPKYIPHDSKMYVDLTHATPPGAMYVWHMNLALKPLPMSQHSSWVAAIPFFVLVALAVGIQYFQMAQLNGRNSAASQMSSQMKMFQRITPILFAYIYFIIPAAAVIYMVVSSLIRILTQDLIFRAQDRKPVKEQERSIPGAEEPAAKDDTKNDTNSGGKVTSSSTGSNAKTPAPKPAPSANRSKEKRKRKAR